MIKQIFCALLLSPIFANSSLADDASFPLLPLLKDAALTYPILNHVVQQQTKYKLQVIYTQIDRDSDGQPILTTYQLGLNDQQYFYPASTVKLPISLLALEWLEQHKGSGISATTTMLTDSASAEQTIQHSDLSNSKRVPNIAHYIKKILLVSDNDASNRLYELLGQDYINNALAAKGLPNSLITHRLSLPLTPEQNRSYNPIRFVNDNNQVLFQLPARISTKQYLNNDKPVIGKAYIAAGNMVNRPMDFSDKNRLSLTDFDGIIKRIVFPELFPVNQRFAISAQQRDFVLRYMSMLPAASLEPKYDPIAFPPNYSKFLMFGGANQIIPDHIKIFNKTGWAYGHVIDGAYIVDVKHQIEFFLTAVVYANDNEVLNDDNYQVEEIALPFLNQLGNFLYQLELKRHRKYKPTLSSIN